MGERHKHVCRKRDPDDPEFDAAYREGALAGEGEACCPEPAPQPIKSAGVVDDAELALYKRMHGCRDRRPVEGECPDCRGLCLRGPRPEAVERDRCFECLRASDNSSDR